MSKSKYLIDLAAPPYIPPEFITVERHEGNGILEVERTRFSLHLTEIQKIGLVKGYDLEKELSGQSTLNANVLDHWLKYPEQIPEECKGNFTFFWKTIYHALYGVRCVRCLLHDGSSWRWYYYSLVCGFGAGSPAIIVS